MRRSLLALLALLCAAVASPARAAGDARFEGGCGFDTVADLTGATDDPYRERGVLYAVVAAYSASGPVAATVECELYSYAGPIGSFTAGGTGLVTGAIPVDYVLAPWDSITLCTRVDFADDTPDFDVCVQPDSVSIPPYEVARLGAGVVEAAGLTGTVCAVTASVPDVGRVIRSEDDGDLYRDGTPAWDCS